jgi:hypothetical protein
VHCLIDLRNKAFPKGKAMPYLFCEKHGREHEDSAAGQQEAYRQEGESVLTMRGTLISGPWLCDRCNASLTKGTHAYLASAFPAWVGEGTEDYDFAYERRYFAVEKAEAKLYGARWPGLAAALAGRSAQPVTRRPAEPLCALDLFRKPEPAE